MGRLLKKKTEAQVKKKKLKLTAGQDSETGSSPADSRSRETLSAEKTSKSQGNHPVVKTEKKGLVSGWIRFFKEARAELEKVVWPSKAQAIASTVVVIVLVLILSLFLGVSDAILTMLVQLALN